jgi:hypothetical protein
MNMVTFHNTPTGKTPALKQLRCLPLEHSQDIDVMNQLNALLYGKLLDSSKENKQNIRTLNRIRDIYPKGFSAEFWERIGNEVRYLPVSELVPVTINPMEVQAAQETVGFQAVEDLLKLRVRSEFWPIVQSQHDPKHPIIVIWTPFGYISVDGHHRLRALQLRGDKQVRVYTLPMGHAKHTEVIELFQKIRLSRQGRLLLQ